MPEDKEKNTVYVRVTDKSGKEYLCPRDALKEAHDLTEEELKYCLDSARESFTDDQIMAIIRSEFRKEPKDPEK